MNTTEFQEAVRLCSFLGSFLRFQWVGFLVDSNLFSNDLLSSPRIPRGPKLMQSKLER